MIEKISQEWNLRGFSCDSWIDPPGKEWKNYHHEVDELFMVLEGDIEIEIDGVFSKPQHNEVIYIPAHTKHSIYNRGKTRAKWLYGYKIQNTNESDIRDFNK